MKITIILCISLLFVSCSKIVPFVNKPLTELQPKNLTRNSANKPDDISFLLTFSGGGTRAAALSYGVLKTLRDINVTKKGKTINLLSQVKVISSVSGGSFTSAYYGLYGNRIFKDFEKAFLRKPIQSQLEKKLLSTRSWYRLSSPYYGRGDMAAEHYTRSIFGDKTYADFRKTGPRIVINATDVASGVLFSFTEENFRLICSDLQSYPIARAVTASSAVPVLFTSITLKNHAGCIPLAFQMLALRSKEAKNTGASTVIRKYLAKKDYPYLHLMDGGITDNLGVRSLLRMILQKGGNFWEFMQQNKLTNLNQIVFVVVNASPNISPKMSLQQITPNMFDTLDSISTIQFARYNQDTLGLLRHYFAKWEKQVKKGRCAKARYKGCDDMNFYLAELNFNQLPRAEALRFSQITTSFSLPNDQVTSLINVGGVLLKGSPEFQRFMRDTQRK